MVFSIDVKKLVRGTLCSYPSIEFTGMTIRNILEEITGQSIAIIVGQGMEGAIVVCGNNEIETLFKKKCYKVMSAWAILSLWQDSPIVGIVWPPIPTLISIEKNSSPVETGFEIPEFVKEHLKNPVVPKTARVPKGSDVPQSSLFDPAPVSADDLFQQGYAELSGGRLDNALTKFKQAVTLKPEFERAWSALGFALEEACKDDDALAAYSQAAKLDGKRWETAYALGRILVRKRRLPEGIERLETAMSLSKQQHEVVALLANAYAQCGELRRAAELMSAA